MGNINHESAPEEMADAVKTAAADLNQIAQDNTDTIDRFETAGWSGLDQLNTVRDRLSSAADSLVTVGEKLGLAAEVKAAYLNNSMVGNKASVTESGRQ